MGKNMKRKLSVALIGFVTVSMLAGCGQSASNGTSASSENSEPGTSAASTAEVAAGSSASSGAADTITVMVPPVTNDYADKMTEWADEFHTKYPNLTLEVINTSWDDHNTKLSTMAQAGEAPDIAELSYSNIGTYVSNGTAVDITKYMDADMLKDYDQNALDYMTLDGATYGLPLYITIQALGGNKDMLEAAGVDVAKVQSDGWTYDQFLSAIKAGTKGDTFGFVFANSGVTASDFINIFGATAGITNAFDSNLKYTY